MGLYRQGLFHDLSKYSPAEFVPGVKYFDGTHSPNQDERDELGYSAAWLHHQGRNKHHFEYWVDYTNAHNGQRTPVKIPLRYVCEMAADRYAACRTYNKEKYTQRDPLDYFNRNKARTPMHEETKKLLEGILTIMAEQGEDAAFRYARNLLRAEKSRKKDRKKDRRSGRS